MLEITDLHVYYGEIHALKGVNKGRYAVWISENWRLTFGWDAIEVALEDYH